MGKGIVDGFTSTRAAYDFALFYERREEDRWALADICALVGQLPALVDELSNNFGIGVTLQTLKNYARVSKSFEEEHRHLQYKWSNYLEWSKWEHPVEAMETALDHGYSPSQMARLRRYGDPEYKKPTPRLCQVCGGELGHCHHEGWANTGEVAEGIIYPGPLYEKLWQKDDEGETGGLEFGDSQSQGAAEDRRKAVGPAEEVQEQGKMG